MRFLKWQHGVLATVTVVVAAGLALQQQAAIELRDEVELLRESTRDFARVRAENLRLAAARVAAAELETLRADRAAVVRLRGEIDALQKRGDELPPRAKAAPAAVQDIAAVSAAPRTPIMDEVVPAKLWTNAGRATPAAALETTLWAAAGGDVDVLASGLVFDAQARAKAEAIFAGLPDGVRARYGSPERLIAMLTARDVPLEGAHIIDTKARKGNLAGLGAQLLDASGTTRMVFLVLRQDGPEWKLVVPTSAVEKYARMLAGGPVAK